MNKTIFIYQISFPLKCIRTTAFIYYYNLKKSFIALIKTFIVVI